MVFRKKLRVVVQYGALPIGELQKDQGRYVFTYLPDFFSSGLKPLSDFPDPKPGKTYRNARLWPFFKNRIPDLSRDDVREWLKQDDDKTVDEMELLVKLGRESVNNPFHLVPAW